MESQLPKNTSIPPSTRIKRKKGKKNLDLLRRHILNARTKSRQGHYIPNTDKQSSLAKMFRIFTETDRSRRVASKHSNKNKKRPTMCKQLLPSKPCIGIYRNGAKSKQLSRKDAVDNYFNVGRYPSDENPSPNMRYRDGNWFDEDKQHSDSDSQKNSQASGDDSSPFSKMAKRRGERCGEMNSQSIENAPGHAKFEEYSPQKPINRRSINTYSSDRLPTKSESIQSVKRWRWAPVTCFEEICANISLDFLSNEFISKCPDPIAENSNALRLFYISARRNKEEHEFDTLSKKLNTLNGFNDNIVYSRNSQTEGKKNLQKNIGGKLNIRNGNPLSSDDMEVRYLQIEREKIYGLPNADNDSNAVHRMEVPIQSSRHVSHTEQKIQLESTYSILRKLSCKNNTGLDSLDPSHTHQGRKLNYDDKISRFIYDESKNRSEFDCGNGLECIGSSFKQINGAEDVEFQSEKIETSIKPMEYQYPNWQWNNYQIQLPNPDNYVSNPFRNDFRSYFASDDQFEEQHQFFRNDKKSSQMSQATKYIAVENDHHSSKFPKKKPIHCPAYQRDRSHNNYENDNCKIYNDKCLLGPLDRVDSSNRDSRNRKYRRHRNLVHEEKVFKARPATYMSDSLSFCPPCNNTNVVMDFFPRTDEENENNTSFLPRNPYDNYTKKRHHHHY